MASRAYKNREDRIWKQDLESSPHGAPWSTSFHASKFPGNPATACGRQALYGLMNIPAAEPVSEHGRAIMDAGKAIEEEYVSRWEEDGVLLSRPPTDKYQTGFKDERYWLTGNLDAVIWPEGWDRGHAVEIKSKDHSVIDEMKAGMRQYDYQHYSQLQVYLGFLQSQSESLYSDYRKRTGNSGDLLCNPVVSGSILYVSRDRPRHTHEFIVDFESGHWDSGTDLLKKWQDDYVHGLLPGRDPNWKWLDVPCKYCPVKRLCKADDKAGVVRLSDSNAIPFSRTLRPSYDYLQQRSDVLKRWNAKDESSTDDSTG